MWPNNKCGFFLCSGQPRGDSHGCKPRGTGEGVSPSSHPTLRRQPSLLDPRPTIPQNSRQTHAPTESRSQRDTRLSLPPGQRVSSGSFLIDGRQSEVTPDERLIVTRLVVGETRTRTGAAELLHGLCELIESIVVAWSDVKIDPAVGLRQPPAACQSGSPSS